MMRKPHATPVLTREELDALDSRVGTIWRWIWADAVALMVFSAHVGAALVAGDRAEGTQPLDYLLPVTIDVAMCIGLVSSQALSVLAVSNPWGRTLCWFTALATLGLNVGGSLDKPAMIAVHAITPVLLVILTETAQSISTKVKTALATLKAAEASRAAAERLVAARTTKRTPTRRQVDTHLDSRVDSPGGHRGVDTPLDTLAGVQVSTPGVHDHESARNSDSAASGNAEQDGTPRRPQLVVDIPDDVMEILLVGTDKEITQASVARQLKVSTKTIQRRVNAERENRGIGQPTMTADESSGG